MEFSPELLEQVRQRWAEFEVRGFPEGHRTKQFQGKTLTLLQSEIAGFIMTYLQTGGALGSRQVMHLQDSLQVVNSALPEMSDDGKEHFKELTELGKIVLDSAHDQPT